MFRCSSYVPEQTDVFLLGCVIVDAVVNAFGCVGIRTPKLGGGLLGSREDDGLPEAPGPTPALHRRSDNPQHDRLSILYHSVALAAEKFREFVGEEASSKSGKFTFLNCFDMGSGSLACVVKEGVKLYVYNIRNAHVERARQRATEIALTEALTEGLSASVAAKQAQKTGAKAAKEASRQAKRILGPILSSGWDFFEALYFGGTITEGFLRGAGTLFGTYAGGYHGEQRLGRFGYLMGSHLGSWVGGRMGLMVYDIVNGIDYLIHFVQPEEETSSGSEDADNSREMVDYENPSEQTDYYETLKENPEASEDWRLF
ncbi:hypothetical protein MUK42_02336 [Musa troglodytarum]|uniref:Uncharacterized protein n=1 Tax=Musa troglodytarum TaxID=320322 RepID=A0A9E7EVV7_9LILI|nr:hypothetical protein MUK42_02336 [Musa troglodytarum]